MSDHTYHSWDRSSRKGARGERIVSRAFEPEYVVVQGTDHHNRRQGVDYVFIERRDVKKIALVDIKYDDTGSRTLRLPFEDGHEFPNRKWQTGWPWVTEADFVVFYHEARDRGYSLSLPAIRAGWERIRTQARRVTGTIRHGERWRTFNYCCPIDWLKAEGFILREFDVQGDQGSFWLRPIQQPLF